MNIADYFLQGLGSIIQFAINLLPGEVSFFTIADLNSLLSSIENFWVRSFSVGSHFFPFSLLFTVLGLILLMEMALLIFRAIKFVVNVLRGSGG